GNDEEPADEDTDAAETAPSGAASPCCLRGEAGLVEVAFGPVDILGVVGDPALAEFEFGSGVQGAGVAVVAVLVAGAAAEFAVDPGHVADIGHARLDSGLVAEEGVVAEHVRVVFSGDQPHVDQAREDPLPVTPTVGVSTEKLAAGHPSAGVV